MRVSSIRNSGDVKHLLSRCRKKTRYGMTNFCHCGSDTEFVNLVFKNPPRNDVFGSDFRQNDVPVAPTNRHATPNRHTALVAVSCNFVKNCYNSDMNDSNKTDRHYEQTCLRSNRNSVMRLLRCFAPRNDATRAAFTLAEVLITLGIIGVVAALTLPTLIHKQEMMVLKNQFKKSYANFQNAVNTTQSQRGIPYECYNRGNGDYHNEDCVEFWQDFFSNVKVLKTCRYGNAACSPTYKTKAEVLAQGGAVTNNNCSFDFGNYNVNILSDGSYILARNLPVTSTIAVYFTLDINGAKGPNKWGYDVFSFVLNRENEYKNTVVMDEVCAIKEKDGFYAREMFLK